MKKSFYSNDKILSTMPILSAVSWLAYAIAIILLWSSIPGMLQYNGFYLFQCLVIVFLMFYLKKSYLSHSKNVMKGLMGGLLIAIIFLSGNNIYLHIAYAIEYQEAYGTFFTLSSIADAIVFFAMIRFSHNHFIINSDHHSSPDKIKNNQLMNSIIIIFSIVGFAFSVIEAVIEKDSLMYFNILGNVMYYLSFITVYLMVMYVETKLDYFRELREAAAESAK